MRLSALILVVRERSSLSDWMLEIFIPSTNLSHFLYRNLDRRNSWFQRNLLDEEEEKRRKGERKEGLQKSSTSTIVPKNRGKETKTDKREREQEGKRENKKEKIRITREIETVYLSVRIFDRSFVKPKQADGNSDSTKDTFHSGNWSAETSWPNIVIRGYIIAGVRNGRWSKANRLPFSVHSTSHRAYWASVQNIPPRIHTRVCGNLRYALRFLSAIVSLVCTRTNSWSEKKRQKIPRFRPFSFLIYPLLVYDPWNNDIQQLTTTTYVSWKWIYIQWCITVSFTDILR